MVAIYCDAASLEDIRKYAPDPRIQGFTTNPSLMKKAGITDYRSYARAVLEAVENKPVSFEVLSSDINEMVREAGEIASWGTNVYVKVPAGISIDRFWGLRLNLTAVMTLQQIRYAAETLNPGSIVSIFAGRIADTGVDPIKTMRYAVNQCAHLQVLWASAREVLNFYQADAIGCDIITMTPDLIEKLRLGGKDLDLYSRETAQQFFEDAKGITL